MTASWLRVPRALVLAGFVLAALGNFAYLVQIGVRAPFSLLGDALRLVEVGTMLGYLVVGVAFWVWLGTLHRSAQDLSALRGALRLFAVGTALLGIACVGPIYVLATVYSHASHAIGASYLWSGTAGDVLALIGFLMAGAGFWIVARGVGRSRVLPPGGPLPELQRPLEPQR